MSDALLELPERVRRDVAGYGAQVARFLGGEMSEAAFRAYRVPMGIYEQRQKGTFMVRIRVAAGQIRPAQLVRVAQLSERYGNGTVHVTTRQDLQIHDVALEDTDTVQQGLLEVGLSSRGGGGNTVRNISACPRAGVCGDELFDVAPHATAVTEYLLQFDGAYHLPRKYKIAFSGCATDCALASVADLGFFARVQDGRRGFAVFAGGGLGRQPAVALSLEDFVPEPEIFAVAEAVRRLFDRHGDRTNRHRARLRFVARRLGPEAFRQEYRRFRAELAQQGLPGRLPDLAAVIRRFEPAETGTPDAVEGAGSVAGPGTWPEKHAGFVSLRLRLARGDIGAADLIRVAQVAAESTRGTVRTTQQQDLILTGVPVDRLETVRDALGQLRASVLEGPAATVVACAGAATCKLGLCRSRGLARAIERRLAEDPRDLGRDGLIRISGCPNACGQHLLAEVGLQGRARRIDGRLLPCYDVFGDAVIGEGRTRLGRKLGTVPAKRIPDLVADYWASKPRDVETLERLVATAGQVTPESLAEDDFCDYDQSTPFSLAGLGPGECGAGVLDVVQADVQAARQALQEASTDAAARYAARALLILFGVEPKSDEEILEAVQRHLVGPGWVAAEQVAAVGDLLRGESPDGSATGGAMDCLRAFVDRIEELFKSLDSGLKFTVRPVATPAPGAEPAREPARRIDLRGVACPLNFVKAKLALEQLAVGDVLEVLLDAGEPIRNVPASFKDQGQEICAVTQENKYYCVQVRRNT